MSALTVTLPPRFLARDVRVGVERRGHRWAIIAFDAVGNAWPVAFAGSTDATLYHSEAAALESLTSHGGAPGDRIFAQPSERF